MKDKKALINVRNNDAEFFKWALLSAVYHEEINSNHTDMVQQYQSWKDELNFTGLEFPVEVDKIGVFERFNPNYAINVFAVEGREIDTLCISKTAQTQPRGTIHLLLIDQDGRRHYT